MPSPFPRSTRATNHPFPMTTSTLLLIILLLLVIGAVPSWPHSRGWGYGPSGVLGLILVILLIMALTGRL